MKGKESVDRALRLGSHLRYAVQYKRKQSEYQSDRTGGSDGDEVEVRVTGLAQYFNYLLLTMSHFSLYNGFTQQHHMHLFYKKN